MEASLTPAWPGTNECLSPAAVLIDVLGEKLPCSDKVCNLVCGLLDAFATAFNFRRTNQG